MSSAGILVAVDGGGTRTRAIAFDRSGAVLGRAESGPSNHLVAGREAAARSLRGAVAATVPGMGAESVFVCAALAGVDYNGAGAEEACSLLRDAGYEHASAHSDMVAAHYGALAGEPGVMALAGTGAALLGIDARGGRVKVDGWGPVYGDEGSAYWIASRGLRAAARAEDGRGPATALVPAFRAALRIESFEASILAVYGGSMGPREIASLSRTVGDIAGEGDGVARGILREAGEALAGGVEAAVRRLGLEDGEPLVSYQGAVLEECGLVREFFASALASRVPGARLVAPRFPPVIGAYLLGCEALGWEPVCVRHTTS